MMAANASNDWQIELQVAVFTHKGGNGVQYRMVDCTKKHGEHSEYCFKSIKAALADAKIVAQKWRA